MDRCVRRTPLHESQIQNIWTAHISPRLKGLGSTWKDPLPHAHSRQEVSWPAITCCGVFFCCRSVWTHVATPPRAPSRETPCAPTDSAATTVRCVAALRPSLRVFHSSWWSYISSVAPSCSNYEQFPKWRAALIGNSSFSKSWDCLMCLW